MPDLQSGGCGFESRPGLLRTKVYSAVHPPGSVNEYQLRLGRQRQVWLILIIADERVGVQVKLWNPLRRRVIPERFCGGDWPRRGAVSSVCTTYAHHLTSGTGRHWQQCTKYSQFACTVTLTLTLTIPTIRFRATSILPARKRDTCYGNVSGWLAGWLGGWLAVTLRYCIKTAKPIWKLFRSSESPIVLVSWDSCADTKFHREPLQRGR